MLIELITPLMLATAPATIEVPPTTYSHAAQGSMEPTGQFRTSTMTANGTQTFDYKGKPWDADSDSDQD
jgi:hypothetical protein